MDGESKSKTYVRVAARVVLGLILVALLAFFIVRLVQNQRDTRVAQDAAKAPDKSSSQNSGQDSSDNNGSGNSESTGTKSESSIPSGVADSDAMPNVGMDQRMLYLTTMVLAIAAFLATKQLQVVKS